MLKRFAALFLVVLMSIDSLAAVVGDSDGGAFVTKKEFEDLKANFDEQIEKYNNSLDRKIDGAIANYLYGMNLEVWQKMKLDPKSQYRFPLVMCGPNNEWNNPDYKSDTGSHYFDLSVPKYNEWQHYTQYGRNGGGGGSGANESINKKFSEMPSSVPAKTHDADNQVVRVAKTLTDLTYDGYIGTMNLFNKSTDYREINGVNHVIFDVHQRGRGQLTTYTRGNAMGNFWDGDAEYTPDDTIRGKWYNYPIFIGLDPSNFNTPYTTGTAPSWNVASGTKPKVNTWTRNGVYSFRGINGNVKNYMGRTDLTNMKDILDYISSALFVTSTYGSVGENSSGDKWAYPYLVLPEWQHTEGTNTCYYGTGCMQATLNQDGGYYSLTPVAGTSAATQKIEKILPQDQSQNFVSIFNYSQTRSFSTFSPFMPNNIYYIPYWVATANNNFSQDTSNHFSMIRASVARYYDSNKEEHFLDEGMYLGTSEKGDATVKFKIRFVDDSNWSVDLALSKKPFQYDAVADDQIGFTWSQEDSTTKNTVAKGGTARLTCNKTYNIEFTDVDKGDKLYMKWTPATTGHYVALESFSDFYIRGT